MAVVVLIVDDKGNVLDVQRRAQPLFWQIVTSSSNAYTFGNTQGVSLETSRLQLAARIREGTALTEEQKNALIVKAISELTVHDTIRLEAAGAGGTNNATGLPVGAVGGPSPQPKKLLFVMVDP